MLVIQDVVSSSLYFATIDPDSHPVGASFLVTSRSGVEIAIKRSRIYAFRHLGNHSRGKI